MKSLNHVLPSLLLIAAATAGAAAFAQGAAPADDPGARSSNSTILAQNSASGSSMGTGTDRNAWAPAYSRGYLGLSVGSPRYGTPCGNPGLSCDNPSTSYKVYTGAMFSNYFGAEIAYLDMSHASRAGGDASAKGLNFSLVGRAPIAQSFGLFGKVGTTYGRTQVSAAAGSGVATGNDSGWGLSYGAGLSFDFSQNWSAVLEWERHNFRFAGSDREAVKATSLGLQYRF